MVAEEVDELGEMFKDELSLTLVALAIATAAAVAQKDGQTLAAQAPPVKVPPSRFYMMYNTR